MRRSSRKNCRHDVVTSKPLHQRCTSARLYDLQNSSYASSSLSFDAVKITRDYFPGKRAIARLGLKDGAVADRQQLAVAASGHRQAARHCKNLDRWRARRSTPMVARHPIGLLEVIDTGAILQVEALTKLVIWSARYAEYRDSRKERCRGHRRTRSSMDRPSGDAPGRDGVAAGVTTSLMKTFTSSRS